MNASQQRVRAGDMKMVEGGMRTIIAGSRSIEDYSFFCQCLWHYQDLGQVRRITTVVSGAAKGVDTMAIRWAKAKNINVQEYRADWERQGDSYDPMAGIRRNEVMAKAADALLAIWDGESRGTRDMIERAKAHGLAIAIYNAIHDSQGSWCVDNITVIERTPKQTRAF